MSRRVLNNTVTVQPKRAVCSNRWEGRGFPTSFSLKAFSLSPFFFFYSLYPISSFFPRAKALLFAGCESLKRGDELKTTGRNENRVSDRRIICLTSLEIFTNARIFTRYSFFYPLLHPPWLMERGPLYHPGARRIPGTNSLAWMEREGGEKRGERVAKKVEDGEGGEFVPRLSGDNLQNCLALFRSSFSRPTIRE